MQFTDEWLVPTLETLVPEEAMTAVREDAGDADVALGASCSSAAS